MQDELLLQILRKDAERGMRLLIEHYGALVYTVVKSKLSPDYTADIEDVVSETFGELYLSLDRYDPSRGSIKSYLCTVAKHNAIDYLRRYASAHLPLDEALAYPDEVSFDDKLTERERHETLLKAIAKLDATDRHIIVKKYYLGESTKDIAAALGMTVSAIDTRAHRAIQKLKKQFGGENV